MPLEMTLLLGMLLVVLLLSLLKLEKLVKITFGSYLLLAFSLAFGTILIQAANHLQSTPQDLLLGMSYESLAKFLLNAQPTLILVASVAGIWIFAQYAHLKIDIANELFERKLQTFLWGILSVISLLTLLYFSLTFFKGAVYEWLFLQEVILPYSSWIPLLSLVSTVLTFFAASHIKFSFGFRKDSSSNPLLS